MSQLIKSIIVFENDQYLVKSSVASPTQSLVVTFSGRTFYRGTFKRNSIGWAEEFLIKKGYHFVAIVSKTDDWYQGLIDGPELDVITEYIARSFPEVERVIVYGSSMGGYASIKFSRRLKATHVLALSPPCMIKDHPIWSNDVTEEIESIRPEDVSSSCVVHVAYDPLMCDSNYSRTLDAIHAKKMHEILSSHVNLFMHGFPFFGHPVTETLAEIGLLSKMIDGLVCDGRIHNFDIDRRRLLGSPKYVRLKAKQLVREERYCQASRLVFLTRHQWIEGKGYPGIAIRALSRSGMFPRLLNLLKSRDCDR